MGINVITLAAAKAYTNKLADSLGAVTADTEEKLNKISNTLTVVTSTLDNLERAVSSLSMNINELSDSLSNIIIAGDPIDE